MEYPIKFSQDGPLYILRGHRLIFPKNIVFFLWSSIVLANRAETDEMLHYATFHLGLHCLIVKAPVYTGGKPRNYHEIVLT